MKYVLFILCLLLAVVAQAQDTPTPTATATAVAGADYLTTWVKSANGPFVRAYTITPDSYNNLSRYPRAIYVGTTGNVQVLPITTTTPLPSPVQFDAVPAGTILNIRVKKVLPVTTGTPAEGLIGLE